MIQPNKHLVGHLIDRLNWEAAALTLIETPKDSLCIKRPCQSLVNLGKSCAPFVIERFNPALQILNESVSNSMLALGKAKWIAMRLDSLREALVLGSLLPILLAKSQPVRANHAASYAFLNDGPDEPLSILTVLLYSIVAFHRCLLTDTPRGIEHHQSTRRGIAMGSKKPHTMAGRATLVSSLLRPIPSIPRASTLAVVARLPGTKTTAPLWIASL
jgi:hypothetical protein